jgi:predicted RNase H-like HicB family nuclease
MKSLMVHIIFYPEDDHYVAHCLEFDIVAQGDSLEESFRNLLDAVELQTAYALETGDMENLIQPAPSEFWRMLMKSENKPEMPLGLKLPRVFSDIECSVVYG